MYDKIVVCSLFNVSITSNRVADPNFEEVNTIIQVDSKVTGDPIYDNLCRKLEICRILYHTRIPSESKRRSIEAYKKAKDNYILANEIYIRCIDKVIFYERKNIDLIFAVKKLCVIYPAKFNLNKEANNPLGDFIKKHIQEYAIANEQMANSKAVLDATNAALKSSSIHLDAAYGYKRDDEFNLSDQMIYDLGIFSIFFNTENALKNYKKI